ERRLVAADGGRAAGAAAATATAAALGRRRHDLAARPDDVPRPRRVLEALPLRLARLSVEVVAVKRQLVVRHLERAVRPLDRADFRGVDPLAEDDLLGLPDGDREPEVDAVAGARDLALDLARGVIQRVALRVHDNRAELRQLRRLEDRAGDREG